MTRGSYSAGPQTPSERDAQPRIRGRIAERRDEPERERLVQRVAAEFREMPCLRLTAAQAERLFGLRPDVNQRIIGALLKQGFLRLDEDGKYAVVPC